MKESIGGISITMIVITLILLFSGIMALTISRSNAIAVKDRVMRIIEEYDGFKMNAKVDSYDKECTGDNALCDILDTINTYSYRQTGTCPDVPGGTVVGYQRDGKEASSAGKAAFCIVKTNASNRDGISRYYYKVIMFYGIDLPVLNQFLNFRATGETKMLTN